MAVTPELAFPLGVAVTLEVVVWDEQLGTWTPGGTGTGGLLFAPSSHFSLAHNCNWSRGQGSGDTVEVK